MQPDQLARDLVAVWPLALGCGLVAGVLHRLRRVMGLYILLALPGVACHELAHGAVGLALGAHPVRFSLLPRRVPGGWVLGEVAFANLTWWNVIPTALAPTLLAPLSLLVLCYGAQPAVTSGHWGWAFGFIYLSASLLQAAWPSPQDFKLALWGLMTGGLIWYGLTHLG